MMGLDLCKTTQNQPQSRAMQVCYLSHSDICTSHNYAQAYLQLELFECKLARKSGRRVSHSLLYQLLESTLRVGHFYKVLPLLQKRRSGTGRLSAEPPAFPGSESPYCLCTHSVKKNKCHHYHFLCVSLCFILLFLFLFIDAHQSDQLGNLMYFVKTMDVNNLLNH